MSKWYLMLGANLGDRKQQLQDAIENIKEQLGPVIVLSSVYESEPWGYEDSKSYFNQAILIDTTFAPDMVLKVCLAIENKLGRVRTSDNYEPRTIDIDLLFYDDIILNTPNLVIPHPRITERKFVLEPMREIAADYTYPLADKTIQELLLACKDTAWVKKQNLH